jgi:hypothetical protein
MKRPQPQRKVKPQSANKRYTPEQYARLKFQREERERVTGNKSPPRRITT